MADIAPQTPAPDEETAPEAVRQRRFTKDEYFRMAEAGVLGPADRTELIDGYLVEMTVQTPHIALPSEKSMLNFRSFSKAGSTGSKRKQHFLLTAATFQNRV